MLTQTTAPATLLGIYLKEMESLRRRHLHLCLLHCHKNGQMEASLVSINVYTDSKSTAHLQHAGRRSCRLCHLCLFIYGLHLGTEDHYVSGVSQVQKDKYTPKSKVRNLNTEVVDSGYRVCLAGSW